MKKLLLAFPALVMMFSIAAKAEPLPPDEFGEMKWGASKADVKAVMSAKGAKTIARLNNDTHLAYNWGSVAGLDVFTWDLYFAADKFCRGQVAFKDNWDNDGLYKQVKKLLTDKYGTRTSETFKPAAEPSSEWRLVNLGASEGIVIRLSINGNRQNRRVKLEYKNEALSKLAPPEHPEAQGMGEGL